MKIHLHLKNLKYNSLCGLGSIYKRRGLYFTDDLQYTTCKTCRQLAIRFNRQFESEILNRKS